MPARRWLAVASALLLGPSALAAQGAGRCSPGVEQEWQRVRVTRFVPPDKSRAQMEQLLLGEARTLAVQQAVGITVSTSTTRSQYEAMANGESREYRDNFFELYSQDAAGLVVEEKHTTTARGTDSLAINYEARVGCETGSAAAGFTGSVSTNQETYREKDYITIRVEVSDSARVYLFSIAQDGSARLIFPNRIDVNNAFAGGDARMVPRTGAPYSFTAELDTRFGPSQNEMLLSIFYLGGGPELFRSADAFEKVFTLEEINRVLLRVPRSERSRYTTGYEIRARSDR